MKRIPTHTLDFIDSWLQLRYKWESFPGISVSISFKGDVVFDKQYGFANSRECEKLTDKHLFHFASHSKVFTATAIMQLQEQSKLRLDDRIIDHLVWLQSHGDSRMKDVTIRQLLSHSAGLRRDGEGYYWQLMGDFPDKDELHQVIMSSQLVFDVSEKFKYSNVGYGLLGEIIEKVTGQTYSQYVQTHIIKRLGLTNTITDYDQTKKFATGYTRQRIDKTREELAHPTTNSLISATGFCSTTADMSRFFTSLLYENDTLLNSNSTRQMVHRQWQTNQQDGYGLGIELLSRNNHNFVAHSGGYPGFKSRTSLDRDSGICVSVAGNCWDMPTEQICQTIFDIVYEMGDDDPDPCLKKYESRVTSIFGISQYYANNKGLRRIYPNSWCPLNHKAVLKRIKTTDEFKITSDDAFGGRGEYVKFIFNDGVLVSVEDGGSICLPNESGDLPKSV